MEKETRNYITTVLTDSMMEQVRQDSNLCLRWKSFGPNFKEEMEDINFISAIKEQALCDALRGKGIYVDTAPIKIQLLAGDCVYVVNPGVKIHELSGSDTLPEHAVLTVTKYWIEHTTDAQFENL